LRKILLFLFYRTGDSQSLSNVGIPGYVAATGQVSCDWLMCK